MAFPPTPGQRAAGKDTAPEEHDAGPTLAQAFAVLEAKATSPRAQSALKTLRSELEGGHEDRPSTNSTSPGMKSAASHMPPAFARGR